MFIQTSDVMMKDRKLGGLNILCQVIKVFTDVVVATGLLNGVNVTVNIRSR